MNKYKYNCVYVYVYMFENVYYYWRNNWIFFEYILNQQNI